MLNNFYVTTPIYYVNDKPHIGHAYTSIAADFFARFNRLAGRRAFFLTGTDEHGTKVAEAAAAASKSPQEFCDEVVTHFMDTWKALGLAHDYFVRTTDERHVKAVSKLLMVLKGAKGPDGRDVIAGPTEPWTWQIAELFKIEKGKIRRIEAVLHRCPYGMNSGWSTYEQGMSDQIQYIK